LQVRHLSAATPQPEADSKVRPHRLDDPFAIKAIDLIERRLSADLTLEAIAASAGLSPYHFHRRFAESMGETVGDYIRAARLNLAASLIARSNTSILEAALSTGYGSQAAFTRAFTRHFGQSPSRLRTRVFSEAPPIARFHHDLAGEATRTRKSNTPLIGMRVHGGYAQVQLHWQSFARHLQERGFDLDRAQPVGILYDDPDLTLPPRIRYDCCIVDEGWSDALVQAPLRRLTLRTSPYAQLPVSGAYALVSDGIFSICSLWLSQHRSVLGTGPAYEIYNAPPWADTHAISATVLVPIA
jgi:AraC family transcriptional regulator